MVKNPYRFYTYAYLREDRTPYYIGKGTKYRAFDRSRKGAKPPTDKSRIIKLKQNLTEEEAFKHEKYMIAVFGRKDLGTGILVNKTDGGDGPAGGTPWNKGKKHSTETKRKIKEKRELQVITQESKDKMSKARKGTIWWNNGTDEKLCKECPGEDWTRGRILQLGKWNIGRKQSEEHIRTVRNSVLKRTSKIYNVTFPDGRSEIYLNLVEIAEKNPTLKLDSGALSKLALGKINTYKNIKIKILDENEQ